MEPKDWISLIGIVSTLSISLTAILINYRRELRQEEIREDERKREHQAKMEEKKFEIRYGKLHEKRVAALSELYEHLSKTWQEIDVASSLIELDPGGLGRDQAERARTTCTECEKFFAINRLYFTKELAGRIDSILHELTESSLNIVSSFIIHDLDNVKDVVAKWSAKRKAVTATLEQIEAEFRNLLGSTTSSLEI